MCIDRPTFNFTMTTTSPIQVYGMKLNKIGPLTKGLQETKWKQLNKSITEAIYQKNRVTVGFQDPNLYTNLHKNTQTN